MSYFEDSPTSLRVVSSSPTACFLNLDERESPYILRLFPDYFFFKVLMLIWEISLLDPTP
jgi:hypothetical protein